MTPLFKTVGTSLLALVCMSSQAFEVKLSVNGCENLVAQAKEAAGSLANHAGEACKNAANAINNMQVPCFWQYQDGILQTTHMHPLNVAMITAGFILGSAAIAVALDYYSKTDYHYAYSEENKMKAKQHAGLGLLIGGLTGALCVLAPKVVTSTAAELIA